MTASKKEYPQAEASRQMFAQALLELMKIKPYKSITIAELSKKSDLSRRTFYRHFDTIDDVLNYQLKQITEEFAEYFWNHYDHSNIQGVIKVFFLYWEKHLDVLFVLQKNNLLFVLLEIVMPAIRARIQKQGRELMAGSLTDKERHSLALSKNEIERMESIFYFISGGAFNLLTRWLENGAVRSADEMAALAADALNYFAT